MSLYRESTDIHKHNPVNPLGLRKVSLSCGQILDTTVPLRFSRKNISLNGNYPGRFILGDCDRVSMIPPDMIPEGENWP